MENVFGTCLNYKTFFIALASKSKHNKQVKKHLDKQKTKIFSDPIAKLKSKMTFQAALEHLRSENKMLDLLGENEEADIFYAEDILAMLDNELKMLPCMIQNHNLILDFQKHTNQDGEPLGIKVFKIINFDSNDLNHNMIRRSEF